MYRLHMNSKVLHRSLADDSLNIKPYFTTTVNLRSAEALKLKSKSNPIKNRLSFAPCMSMVNGKNPVSVKPQKIGRRMFLNPSFDCR